jgi:protein-disulfide isomerase
VVVALIVISQSGDDDGGAGGDLEGAGLIEAEFTDISQRGTVAGERASEVTIAEFGDLQCPACAQFSETVIPDVIYDLVRPGDAAIEFRNFTIIGPDSEVAARAALAASEQGRYWQFVELFYRNQGPENGGYITDEFLRDVAAGAGVPDLEAWEQAREDPKWDERLAETQRLAQQAGFNSTPSILVEGPGGSEPLGSVGSVAEIAAAVERVR